jgi:hypothetical protein
VNFHGLVELGRGDFLHQGGSLVDGVLLFILDLLVDVFELQL